MPVSALIWVDGEPASALPLPDRGLDFGDGLFETLLLWRGVPQFKEFHLERLKAGLDTLGFPDCLAQAAACLTTAAASLEEYDWAALRLTVTRGAGPRGYAAPAEPTPRIIVTAAPLQQDRREVAPSLAVDWAQLRWSSQPVLAGIKHLNRLEQVMVAREISQKQVDDLVVLDQQGHVCSLSAGNLFIVESGRLLTPALETCGIAGTRRRLVQERLASGLSLSVEETHLSPERLLQSEEVFACNSIRGFQPVASLGERQWHKFDTCRQIQQAYAEAMSC